MKYKGLLLLQKGDLDLARQAFEKLRDNGTAGGRAEGYLGLGKVNQKLGAARHEETAQYLKNCGTNLNRLKPDEQDALTRVELHEQLARVQGDPGNAQNDVVTAIDNCKKSIAALSALPSQGRFVSDKNRELSALLWNLEKSHSSQDNVDPQPSGNAT